MDKNQTRVTSPGLQDSAAYDGAGNRTETAAAFPQLLSLDGSTYYTYDTKDQLTREKVSRTDADFTDNFAYDTAGNPTTFRNATKTFNANNQQTATGYTHDHNGNPTSYKGATLTFDPENRLTSYGSILTAKYTGDGLRAWKQPGATGKRYFLYDGTLPIIEVNKDGEAVAVNTFGANGLVSLHGVARQHVLHLRLARQCGAAVGQLGQRALVASIRGARGGGDDGER